MKLTAEQVRDAIERHAKFYEGGDYDEQAIADELNAALGALEPRSNQLEPTRWHELFGTPERAARTIAVIMDKCSSRPHVCGRCKLFDACDDDVNALEWLRGDA